MSRVKVNLTNGSVIDKPVVTAFKGTNGDYLVLDNETNGSMGLPIICVSKLNGEEVCKISDPAEWNSVKENLKAIISGTNLPYLNVSENLKANDDFYTQLTLPVASFDLLKNVYAPVAPVASAPSEEPVTLDAPVEQISDVSSLQSNTQVQPSVLGSFDAMTSSAPVIPDIPAAPVMPEIPVAPAAPVMPEVPVAPAVQETPVSLDIPSFTPAMPSIETPEIPSQNVSIPSAVTVENNNAIDYDSIKANFMSACENMIDGLISKLKNQK